MTDVSLASYLLATARFAVGGVFVIAGAAKLGNRDSFATVLRAFPVARRLLRNRSARLSATILPTVEIVSGGAFASGVFVRPAMFLILTLLLAFSLALTLALIRHESLTCGCFGSVRQDPARWSDLGRNLALALLTIVGGLGTTLSVDGLRLGLVTRRL